MSTPSITVLIGCWNNAATLARAAESILVQTHSDLELIVVDDGSTDASPEVVAALGDERVRYLPLEHQGISSSLNRGLAAARAPVVAIQDADDWSEPRRLERQLSVLARFPEVAVVGSRMRETDADDRELVPRTRFAAGEVNRALLRFNPIPNSCAAFRREVVLAAGGYDPRYRYAMDYDLWLRVADRDRLYAIDEVLATRVMTGTNVAARKERAQMAEVLAIQARTLARRRTLRGAGGMALPALSLATPSPLKRALRRRRGQAL